VLSYGDRASSYDPTGHESPRLPEDPAPGEGRILKLARIIAELEDGPAIMTNSVADAIQFAFRRQV
jgi:hypothetical protein